jgi:hypothetical protein
MWFFFLLNVFIVQIPYFEGAEQFGIYSLLQISLPTLENMVDKLGKMGSKMAILGLTLQGFEVHSLVLFICALVLNSIQVFLRQQGPNRLSWGSKRVTVAGLGV